MKRFLGALVATFMVVAVAMPASAASAAHSQHHPHGGDRLAELQRRYHAWIFGSSTNPLFQDGFCGEVVGGAFFFNVATGSDVEVSCAIPVGTPMVASPGGTIVWQPTDGTTDAELRASLATFAAALDDPAVTLDGRAIPMGPALTQSGVYDIPLEPGNFVQTVDPNVPSDATELRVASAGWLVRLHPMSRGHHTLVVSDTVGGEPTKATFHITITAGR